MPVLVYVLPLFTAPGFIHRPMQRNRPSEDITLLDLLLCSTIMSTREKIQLDQFHPLSSKYFYMHLQYLNLNSIQFKYSYTNISPHSAYCVVAGATPLEWLVLEVWLT